MKVIRKFIEMINMIVRCGRSRKYAENLKLDRSLYGVYSNNKK